MIIKPPAEKKEKALIMSAFSFAFLSLFFIPHSYHPNLCLSYELEKVQNGIEDIFGI